MIVARSLEFLMISIGSLSWRFLLATILLAAFGTPVFGGPFNSEAQDGVDLYNQEEYGEALKSFEAARLSDPQDGNVLYNLATISWEILIKRLRYWKQLKPFLKIPQ